MAFGIRVPNSATGAVAVAVAVAVVVCTFGCNAILGIDEGKLVSTDAGPGGAGAKTDGSASGGDSNGGAGGESAAGGSSGGRAATGGTTSGGGATGTGGAGGKGSGGAAAGGGTGTGGAGTGGANGVADEVRCGTSSCKLASGQVCCVVTTTGEAHCSASCDSSTQQKFACDGAEDCKTPTAQCCYANGATTAACAGACQGRVFCGADADCAPGQYCAPGTGALATVSICTDAPKKDTVWCGEALCDVSRGKTCCYNKTTKTESCIAATACASGDVSFACDGPDDCPAAGAVCCATRTGLGLLTGGQCSMTGTCPMGSGAIECGGANGCAAGSTCCLTAATGAPACAAMCTAAQTVCGTNADCAGATCTLLMDPALGKATGRTLCK